MKSSDIWNELGDTHFKVGEYDKAIDAYCKAIEQKSQSGWAYNNLACIYVQQGKYMEAIPLYQKSLELFSNRKEQAAVWSRLGSVYHQLDEHGKAIQAYQKADEMMPGRANFRLGLSPVTEPVEAGAVLAESGSFQTGLANYADADFTPGFEELTPESVANLSGSEIFRNVVATAGAGSEDNATTWNELGLILFKVGAYEDALDAFRKAIQLDPTFGYLYSNLGQVLVSQGRLRDALENYEKSIPMIPANKDKAVVWTRMGDIYRQLNLNEEGQAAYQLAEALNKAIFMPSTEFRSVSLGLISTGQDRTREVQGIDDLVISVRVHGVIQPLIVCPARNEAGKFLLIAGRRRLEAARLAGLKEVPVIIRQANDQEILELSINENIHNQPIDPFALANRYRQMANDFDLSLEEIAARVARSVHSVANAMKALEFSQGQAQVQFQEIINQSLVEVQREETESQPVGICDPIEEDALEIPVASEAEAPTLWYLESESENSSVMSGDENYPESASLLARARHALKCNPHTKRLWATPSYRA